MKVSDYIVDFLIHHGVTDAFGIPGGVVLDLLYAMQKRKDELCPHLAYHEQGASFAAVGYAQASGKLGVAYATRGPGFTNMITAIADAWCDSIPMLVITAHASTKQPSARRIDTTQEIDVLDMVKKVTKYAKRIDSSDEIVAAINEAYHAAMEGRKGPVALDIAARIWQEEIDQTDDVHYEKNSSFDASILKQIEDCLLIATRPIMMVGNGVPQECIDTLVSVADKLRIPILSGRSSHHIAAKSKYYYGYMGSNGLRYSNFILSKADLMLSIGNRLNFPIESKSYGNLPNQCKIIRIELDLLELGKQIPNALDIQADIHEMLPAMEQHAWDIPIYNEWLHVCDILRTELMESDMDSVPNKVKDVIQCGIRNAATFITDVGCNEFWLSRVCAYLNHEGPVLYSKNFATLGSAIPKAIGAYLATRKETVCFIGDQGMMFNAQELQLIAQERMPVIIVVVNNSASGMIRDKEVKKYETLVHTTESSGYTIPNLKELVQTYGIEYLCISEEKDYNALKCKLANYSKPMVVDLLIDKEELLQPVLPAGEVMQNMHPELPIDIYNRLNNL